MSDSQEVMKQLMQEVQTGTCPRTARRSTFESTSDGNVVRKIYNADNQLESATVISPAQQLSLTARTKLGLSQSQFANLLGISVRTLHEWEQGRRAPSGAARTLLRIAIRHPEMIQAALLE